MKTSRILSTAALAAAMAIGGCQSNNHKNGGHGDDDGVEARIDEHEVPAKVRQGFDRAFPRARVSEVSRETYPNGTVHYAFEFVTTDGKRMEVEFDEDGERLPDH
jgi:hypothetical protein